MTTKRELERLARKAFGRGVVFSEAFDDLQAYTWDELITVSHDNDKTRREMLAAALRGIIAWKEGKE
jgi:hypothetical protein